MNSRRNFIAVSAAALAVAPLSHAAQSAPMPIKGSTPVTEPVLPYATNALEPHISARTVEMHFGTHHKGYFKRLVPMLQDKGWAKESMEDVLSMTINDPKLRGIYNNAGQLYNHNHFWASLSPAKTTPSASLQAAIARDFGSLDKLKEAFKKEANGHFASGWAWLAATDSGQLKIISTHDADAPMAMGMKGLLVIDVWEHAYYLDRQAGRAAYTEAAIENLLNWDFASANFATV